MILQTNFGVYCKFLYFSLTKQYSSHSIIKKSLDRILKNTFCIFCFIRESFSDRFHSELRGSLGNTTESVYFFACFSADFPCKQPQIFCCFHSFTTTGVSEFYEDPFLFSPAGGLWMVCGFPLWLLGILEFPVSSFDHVLTFIN